ncbi:AAA family ATPase [Noviherbaspirillum sp.]|uniref:AAA family ATPase n=1 Tax=Noviherbaspirillum sp. TaxID=1926288 RepID=UPI002FDFDC91
MPEATLKKHLEALKERTEALKYAEECSRSDESASDKDSETNTHQTEPALKEWQNPLHDHAGPVHKLFDGASVDAFSKRLCNLYRDSDSRDRTKSLIKELRSRGEYRKLGAIPDGWHGMLDQMTVMFPNFGEVISYLRAMFTLSSYGDGVPRLDPLLLNGPPGVGKTYFAESFAKALGVGFVCLRMENAQSNSQLSGSSEFWSNTKPSELFSWLIEKDNANPVFFLDELDKATGGSEYDPLSSVYSLFEPDTARTYCDLSYPWLALDASHVLWIATSNHAESLPAPILSRVKRFDIPPPSDKEVRRIVLQIFYRLRKELPPVVLSIKLTKKAVDVLSAHSPRVIRQLLREAISRSLLRGAHRIEAGDIPLVSNKSDRQKVGFC